MKTTAPRERLRSFFAGATAIAVLLFCHVMYQAAVGAGWRHPSGWVAHVGVTSLDSFYFDVPPNDTRSNGYVLTNLQFGFEAQRWSAMLWGNNVFNENYAVRGFYFGNEPPNFENKLYIQRGDPRQVGVTFRYSFR